MTFKQTRLVTADVARLTRFYETVSQANASVISEGYVEFRREPCEGLAIVDPAAIPAYGAGVVEPGANRSAILDFEVADVDAEYARLQDSVTEWVMPPTVQPWGARAILFRDPDGNLVHLFSNP
ncbi:VOC family protein [Mycolicibacterium sp. Dal123E01]|uniref:VOC family protein n=1 Tax=Mycolicibacterium sp. Dal123E01 TaxID=3457578 RepID=UPI00403E9EF2